AFEAFEAPWAPEVPPACTDRAGTARRAGGQYRGRTGPAALAGTHPGERATGRAEAARHAAARARRGRAELWSGAVPAADNIRTGRPARQESASPGRKSRRAAAQSARRGRSVGAAGAAADGPCQGRRAEGAESLETAGGQE